MLLNKLVHEGENFVVNYRALSKRKNKLNSATLFLRDMLDIMVSGQRPYDNRQGNPFFKPRRER